MTHAEKQALAKSLGEIADKLEGAKDVAAQDAEKHLAETPHTDDRDRYPYMVGSLQFATRDAAESIRAAIRAHLDPRPRHTRGRR